MVEEIIVEVEIEIDTKVSVFKTLIDEKELARALFCGLKYGDLN